MGEQKLSLILQNSIKSPTKLNFLGFLSKETQNNFHGKEKIERN